MLYSYLRYNKRLLHVFLMFAAIILELYEKPRSKDWVTENSTEKNLCEWGNSFSLHAFLRVIFSVDYIVFSLPFLNNVLLECPRKILNNIAMGGIFGGDIMSEQSKISNSPAS